MLESKCKRPRARGNLKEPRKEVTHQGRRILVFWGHGGRGQRRRISTTLQENCCSEVCLKGISFKDEGWGNTGAALHDWETWTTSLTEEQQRRRLSGKYENCFFLLQFLTHIWLTSTKTVSLSYSDSSVGRYKPNKTKQNETNPKHYCRWRLQEGTRVCSEAWVRVVFGREQNLTHLFLRNPSCETVHTLEPCDSSSPDNRAHFTVLITPAMPLHFMQSRNKWAEKEAVC